MAAAAAALCRALTQLVVVAAAMAEVTGVPVAAPDPAQGLPPALPASALHYSSLQYILLLYGVVIVVPTCCFNSCSSITLL